MINYIHKVCNIYFVQIGGWDRNTELKILCFWVFITSMTNTHEQLARKFVKYVTLT
jgi:hypothetical protein